MEYRGGKVGRIFIARIDHEEDLHQCLDDLVEAEGVDSGVVFVIGATGRGWYVAGPVEKQVPPEPNWQEYGDARELLGIGTIAGGQLHLHGVLPRGDGVVGGCLRDSIETYLTLEAVVLEASDISVTRDLDEELGIDKLVFQ